MSADRIRPRAVTEDMTWSPENSREQADEEASGLCSHKRPRFPL